MNMIEKIIIVSPPDERNRNPILLEAGSRKQGRGRPQRERLADSAAGLILVRESPSRLHGLQETHSRPRVQSSCSGLTEAGGDSILKPQNRHTLASTGISALQSGQSAKGPAG